MNDLIVSSLVHFTPNNIDFYRMFSLHSESQFLNLTEDLNFNAIDNRKAKFLEILLW